MPETAKIDEDFTCTFTFKNTLSIPLEKCELNVEGLGIFKLEKFEHGYVNTKWRSVLYIEKEPPKPFITYQLE